jgi:transcriptional regulator with PAS, ATPase and Fis domain
VAINCSAIPENLFESELFGHEKGSFTGADQRKIGKFQYAEGGTLFLDELGDMPPLMQVKLLRVLQEKVFSPVGSNREIRTNVRIIAATNRPLEDYMSKGKFREDLYYRLNVMPIFLPSLSERTQDIKTISYSFLNKFNKKHNKNIKCISNKSLELFENYNWPGNIRELENVIEHAFILEETDRIELSSLPENLLNFSGIELVTIDSDQTLNKKEMDELNSNEENTDFEIDTSLLDFNKQKEEFEKSFIIKALKQFNGKINQTALNANIPKKTLLRKIEKYNIIAKDYKD